MNKQEAIEEILKINHTKLGLDFDDEVKVTTVIDIISQIYEPQKPVIPQFVADWLEKVKANMLLSSAFISCKPNEVEDWFRYEDGDTDEIFARAWLYGYEVIKPQLYTVEIPAKYNSGYTVLSKNSFNHIIIDTVFNHDWKKQECHRLTESEINRYFEWARKWAEPVEGTND